MILTPSVESAFICGDENAVGLNDLSGLGLVSFMFDPHSSKQKIGIEALNSKADLFMASDDDAVIYVNGEKRIIGTPELIERVTA